MDNAKFSELLKEKDLFFGDVWERIEAETTNIKKNELFLNEVIERSFRSGYSEEFIKLLEVMLNKTVPEKNSLKQLANEIIQDLNKGIVKSKCFYLHIFMYV